MIRCTRRRSSTSRASRPSWTCNWCRFMAAMMALATTARSPSLPAYNRTSACAPPLSRAVSWRRPCSRQAARPTTSATSHWCRHAATATWSLYVKAPYDPVKKGQPLLALYVPDWIAAQEEFLSAKRLQGAGTEGLVDAARQRMRLSGMGDEQIREVEASGAVQARVTITAPASGVVSELDARVGRSE